MKRAEASIFPYFFVLGLLGGALEVSWWVIIITSLVLGYAAAYYERKAKGN